MILLNFSHPLPPDELAVIERLAGASITDVLTIPTQFPPDLPFTPQVRSLVDSLDLSPNDWQTLPILIIPPSLNTIALALIAELHGRMGYFPPVLRLKPVAGALPPRFTVAEIINLQELREQARLRRVGS